MHEQLLSVRKMMKENADARISDVCTDTPEKIKGHKRLGATMNRISKHVNVLQEEVLIMNETKQQLQSQLNQMLENEPNLKPIVELEDAKLKALVSMHKVIKNFIFSFQIYFCVLVGRT